MNDITLWRRFDDRWRTWSKTRQLVTYVTAFVVVVLISAGVVAVADRASGAEPDVIQNICQPGGNPELSCLTNAQLVDKFKAGQLGRTAGFDRAAAFKNPDEFRLMAHSRMVTWLGNHPTAEGELRAKYLTKLDPGCTDNCLAWKIFGDLMDSSNCDPAAPLGVSPTTCEPFETGHQKAVVRGITLAYCGGALILGATGTLATDGAAAPAAAVIYGGIGCGWGFMASFF